MIIYTITAENGHTGCYHLNAVDLDSDIGDTILVNVSYGGCQGNNSVDVNDWPSRRCNVTISGNLPPAVPDKPSGPASGYSYAYLEFSTKTTDPDDPADQVRYGWDWDGDDTVDEWTDFYDSNETCNTTHWWQQTGTYAVKVKAQDGHGAERGQAWSEAFYITIISSPAPPNRPPSASFSYTPTAPLVGQTVSFTDTSTDDGNIVGWSWNFGDGTSSNDQNPSHIYTESGTYTVTLNVTDNRNSIGYTQQIITVSRQPLPPDKDWQETANVNLTYNSNNRGLNYMVWRGAAIMASRLAEKTLLSSGDYISIFSKTEGEWLIYKIGESNELNDFLVSPWDTIIVYSTSIKSMAVDISEQDNTTQSIHLSYTYDEQNNKGNRGYTFFAWSASRPVSIKALIETYNLTAEDIEISKYDTNTNTWRTFNPSLPELFQDSFDINQYDIICIKLSKQSKERELTI